MKIVVKLIVVILMIGFVPGAFAQGPDLESLIQSLSRQITELETQIINLQIQLKIQTRTEIPAKFVFKFTKTLRWGVRGNEVRELQKFLKEFPDVYPEGLVTGYFGLFTERAIKRFQEKQGIESVGIVGPKTIAKLNELLTSGAGASGVIPPGLIIAPGIQKIITGLPENATSQKPPLAEPLPPESQHKIHPRPAYDFQTLAIEIQELINQKRNENGLASLVWDNQVAQLAIDHSQDQAKDNAALTNPDFLCHYPLIRHEGFSFGFSLKERVENRGISYRLAGENIAIFPFAKNLVYTYLTGSQPPACPTVQGFESAEGTKEERTKLYQETLNRLLEAIKNLQPITWVNKEWHSADDIKEKIVEGWMNSAGHRQNILNKEFNLGGIGVVVVNDYFLVTHNFIGR